MMWEEYYSVLDQLPDWLRKPVAFIVEALPLLKQHSAQLVLDLGCGAGRNSIFLVREGFDVVAIDVSSSALKKARVLSKAEGIHNLTVLRASMTNLPFPRQMFCAVISVSVIHHALKRDIQKAIEEIHIVLRDNGLFLANLLSTEDFRYVSGEKLEEGTFRVLDKFGEKQFVESHHFFSKREVQTLLMSFKRVNLGPLQSGKKERPHKYWKVIAIK